MNKEEKIFADGFSFKRSENAPDFVVGRLSLKVDEAIGFIKKYDKNGWVNLSVKTARSGNHYVELDTFDPSAKLEKKSSQKPVKKQQKVEDESDGLPF
jgi:hypothetical protein